MKDMSHRLLKNHGIPIMHIEILPNFNITNSEWDGTDLDWTINQHKKGNNNNNNNNLST
ncbi:hypothetical protein RhiirA5_503005 [Rhizophagus irregularis]|uniref:Uncharacterized protein n=1 Tax=Rhizophagus irregularis TaxID=588596 RepID=A0A2I1GPK6_9GLOM|nr:hypothetical protein RhiirA5_503005 [Rhizophagus irregularis]PKY48517.1 hypothetical protein RhiirA4_544674 [Rhizophagus irregularis]